jgi:hypothetical protein
MYHVCVDCPTGRHGNVTGENNEEKACPNLCRPGTYGSIRGATNNNTCLPCAIGKSQNEMGKSNCTECEAGKYAAVEGMSSCIHCEPGKYIATTGNSLCNKCAIGRYNEKSGEKICYSCVQGQYAANRGQSKCSLCVQGRYQNNPGSISCKLCPYGDTSLTSASSCYPKDDSCSMLRKVGNYTLRRNCKLYQSVIITTRNIMRIDSSFQNVIETTEKNNKSMFYVYENAQLTLESLNLTNNNFETKEAESGFLSILGGIVYLKNTLFLNGVSKTNGAFLNIQNSSVVVIINSIFRNGKALNNGGAFYITDDSRVSLLNSTILNNFAGKNGGGMYIDNDASIEIVNTKVLSNRANNGDGGGIMCQQNARCWIHKFSTLEQNIAKKRGGGIYTSSNNVAVVDSTMFSNVASTNIGNEIYTNNIATNLKPKVTIVNVNFDKDMIVNNSFSGNNCANTHTIGASSNNKSFCGFVSCNDLKSEFCKYVGGCSVNTETIGLKCLPSPTFYCTFTKNSLLENDCIVKAGLSVSSGKWTIKSEVSERKTLYTLVSPISLLSSSNYLNQEYSHRFFNVIENGALVLDNLEITGGFLNDTISNGIIRISGKNAIVHMKNCIVYNHVAIGNSIILVENGATITIENSTFKNNVANNIISCSYSKCTLSSFSSIHHYESTSVSRIGLSDSHRRMKEEAMLYVEGNSYFDIRSTSLITTSINGIAIYTHRSNKFETPMIFMKNANVVNSSENNFDGNCDGIFNKGSNSNYCGSSGCSSNDGKDVTNFSLCRPDECTFSTDYTISNGLHHVKEHCNLFREVIVSNIAVNISGIANRNELIKIHGAGWHRLFSIVNGGSLSLSYLNLTNGNATEDGNGGAIYLDGKSKLFSFKMSFSRNFASNGGAIFGYGSEITLLNSSLNANIGIMKGGAICITKLSGSILSPSLSNLKMDYSSLNENICINGKGGGLYSSGKVKITNSFIKKNNANEGGAMYLNTGSEAVVLQSEILKNEAVSNAIEKDGNGGAFYLVGTSNLYVEKSILSNNVASQTGQLIFTSKTGNYTPKVTFVNNNFSRVEKYNELKSFAGNGGCIGVDGYCGTFSCATKRDGENYPCAKLVPDDDCVDYDNMLQGVICKPYVVEIVFEGDAVVENEVNQSRGTLQVDGVVAQGKEKPSIQPKKTNKPYRVFSIKGTAKLNVNGINLNSWNVAKKAGSNDTSGGMNGTVLLVGSQASMSTSNSIISNNTAANGGGVFLGEGASMEMKQSTISGNKADSMGGALFIDTSSVANFDGCTFSNNEANSGGGAIAVRGEANFNNVKFENNKAGGGGAIAIFGTATIAGSEFSGNSAGSLGGVLYIDGGAQATLQDCTFKANFVSKSFQKSGRRRRMRRLLQDSTFDIVGGGIIALQDKGSFDFVNTIFNNNGADLGGVALVLPGSHGRFRNCTFNSNLALTGEAVGGVVANFGFMEFQQCIFNQNRAGTNGASIYNQNILIVKESQFNVYTNNGANEVHNLGKEFIMSASKFNTNSFNIISGNQPNPCNSTICGDIGYLNEGGECLPSTVLNLPGIVCRICPKGKARVKDDPALTCTDCIPGKANNKEGASTCASCKSGKYQSDVGKKECSNCPVGFYTDLALTCLPTPPGYYSSNCINTTNFTGCRKYERCGKGYKCLGGIYQPIKCAPGTYQDKAGAPRCNKCAPGLYTDTSGLIDCKQCKGGKFSGTEGASKCANCPIGKSSRSGSTFCTTCDSGTYFNISSKTCIDCPRGYMCKKDSTYPEICYPGKFSLEKSTMCSECEMGQYTTNFGMFECHLCKKGTYTDSKSSKNCTLCPKDTYSSEIGNSALGQCKSCSDSYADHTTTDNKLGSVNPTKSCVCRGQDIFDDESIGYIHAPTDSSEICMKCPEGSLCQTNGGTVKTLITDKGYWRSDDDTAKFYRCENIDVCIGNVSFEENKTADKQCYMGHTGPLCGTCSKGYTGTRGQLCVKCEGGTSYEGITHSVAIGGSVYILLLMLLFVCKTKTTDESKEDDNNNTENENKEHEKKTEKENEEKTEKKNDNDSKHIEGTANKWTRQRTVIYYVTVQERLQILLGFLQINGSLNVSFDVPWPGDFESFIDFSKLANLEISAFSRFSFVNPCMYVIDFISQYYLAMLFLPTILVLTCLTYIVVVKLCKRQSRDHTKDEETVAYYRAIRVFNLIVFIMYPSLGTRIFLLFYCKQLAGTDYLVADYSIKCEGGRFLEARSYGILFLCLYVIGIPLAYFIILYNKRHKLEEQHNLEMFGALYETYEPEFWMWESIEMIKKAFLTGGVLLISPGSSTQILSAIFVLLFYLMLVIRLEPYDDLVDDRLQVLATFATMLNMIIGLLLRLESQHGYKSNREAIYSIILTMNICVVVFIFSQILLPVFKQVFKNTRFGKFCGKCKKKVILYFDNVIKAIYIIVLGKDNEVEEDINDDDAEEEEESTEKKSVKAITLQKIVPVNNNLTSKKAKSKNALDGKNNSSTEISLGNIIIDESVDKDIDRVVDLHYFDDGDIISFLQNLNLIQYAKIFKAENMTLKDLQVGVQNGEITKTDLKDMGIATLKQRNEIFYACKKRVFTQQEDNGESGGVEFASKNKLEADEVRNFSALLVNKNTKEKSHPPNLKEAELSILMKDEPKASIDDDDDDNNNNTKLIANDSDVMENPLSLPQNNKVIKTEKKKSKGKKEKKKRKEKRKDGEEISRTNKKKKKKKKKKQKKKKRSLSTMPTETIDFSTNSAPTETVDFTW